MRDGPESMCGPVAACRNDEIWNYHHPELVLVLAPVVEVLDHQHRHVGRLRQGVLVPRCEPSFSAGDPPPPWTCVIVNHERRSVRTADVLGENEPIVRLVLKHGRWYVGQVTRPD